MIIMKILFLAVREKKACNETKQYTSSTVKCVGRINAFSNTGPHKVSYMLSRSQYGAPLVAQHTLRRYAVSCQVLPSISLVTHSAALMILSSSSFTFCKTMPHTNPQKKKVQRS
jgi:hypothetical protein